MAHGAGRANYHGTVIRGSGDASRGSVFDYSKTAQNLTMHKNGAGYSFPLFGTCKALTLTIWRKHNISGYHGAGLVGQR